MAFKCGFVTILGKPNVGKSTLLNRLVGQKISIVSPKPQTTRNVVTGILNGNGYQAVFLDTPGIHKSKNSLDNFMEKSIAKSLEGVDLIIYIIDGTKKFSAEISQEAQSYAQKDIPLILVVSKVDDSSMERLYPELAKLNTLQNIKEIIPISSFTGQNIDVLKDNILKYLPEGPAMYPTDVATDSTQRFLASEIIREKSLWLLQEEIPHGIAVQIETFNETEKLTKIDATIFCEKENHKRIIIGKNGEQLKKIAEESRKAIEKMVGQKVYLTLWVKVKERWRDSDILASNMGYNKKDLD
ncbi:MAG: GTPase Era [Christensenellales bacterium]